MPWLLQLMSISISLKNSKDHREVNDEFILTALSITYWLVTCALIITGYVHRYPSLTNSKDTREVNDDYEEARRTWKECDACDMHVPMRTYHCSLCNACISIPDHHCYFLGRCVGRANQRFFICFAFYACIGSLIGVWSLIEVMTYYRNYASLELFYYLIPITTVAYFAGYGAVQSFELFYIGLIDFGIGSFLFTGFLVGLGITSVLKGNTPR